MASLLLFECLELSQPQKLSETVHILQKKRQTIWGISRHISYDKSHLFFQNIY